jgi:hypothetical protein
MDEKIKVLRALMKIKRALKLIKEAATDLSDDKEFVEEIGEIEGMLESVELGE